MGILCTLKNIHLTYGNKEIFKDASLTIHSDSKIGLLGLNGQGKSTLLKILAGEVRPDPSTPAFQFDKSKGEENLKYNCFYVPQELPLLDSEDRPIEDSIKDYFFRFYPEIHGIHKKIEDINQKVETCPENLLDDLIEKQKEELFLFESKGAWELISSYESYLKYFNLTDLNKKVKDLSGGEQKKILLSLGFSAQDNLILWDEPTNHLDLETIKLFEERLKTDRTAFILISHDRHLLSSVTNRIFHISRGAIEVFKGNYVDYLVHLKHQEESSLKLISKLKNSLSRETAWMRQGIKARGTRSKKRVENYDNLKDQIGTLKSNARKQLNLFIANSGRKSKILIEADSLSFSYGVKELFKEVNFSLNKGDKIGLMGSNGVGKTSLIKILTGELLGFEGNLKRASDLKIYHFSQMRDELDLQETPARFLGDGNEQVTLPDGRTRHIGAYFESFLFSKDQLHRPIHTFSGGEKNRLQLAKNLLHKADLWIFDEPTNDLDLETLQILETTLSLFEGALILISHDRTFLSNVTNKVWLLKNKKLESFEAGYEQAEAYLEASSYEEQLLASVEDGAKKNSSSKDQKQQQLSYKEKIRLKDLPKIIEECEKSISAFDKELSQTNYSNMDKDLNTKVSKIHEKKEALEEGLLSLYEEMESLEKKIT